MGANEGVETGTRALDSGEEGGQECRAYNRGHRLCAIEAKRACKASRKDTRVGSREKAASEGEKTLLSPHPQPHRNGFSVSIIMGKEGRLC